MANIFGRSVIVILTNKSGGGVIAGDVVVPDGSNDSAFTTTTSAATVTPVWIAQETIASNAAGRVLIGGYAALVNVNASVTRGNYGATHTVAKQAADAGASRTAGTFCRFLTGGTTPTAYVHPTDLLGSSLTNPMTAVGDIIQGTTAGAPAKLVAPLAGKVLTGAGLTTSVAYAYPPGYEFDRVTGTGSVTVSGTSSAGATTILTGNAVTYDGSTAVDVYYFCPSAITAAATSAFITICLFEGSTNLGNIAVVLSVLNTASGRWPVIGKFRLTPTNAAHTYIIKAYRDGGASTASLNAGAGGSDTIVPMEMRIVKA